jgi:exonuclease III
MVMTAAMTPVDAGAAAPAPEVTDPSSGVPGAAPVGAGTEPAEGAAGAAPERALIRIATFNIRSGRAGRLEMVLRAMNQMNVDIGILTEAKLTDGIHTRQSSGYHVYSTSARSHSKGGVVLFFRNSVQWQVESIRHFCPNVISCQLVTGQWWIPVVGAYIPPADESTLEFIRHAMGDQPQRCSPLLLGDLNVNLVDLRDNRARAVAADLATYGFEDLLLQFRQHRGRHHGHTWKQHRDGMMVCSHCDYILGLDPRMFSNVCLKDPCLYASDHLLVLGMLPASPSHEHGRYLWSRRRFSLGPPKWGPPTHADALFQSLTDAIPPPVPTTKQARRSWISAETWKMVDEHSALQRCPSHNRTEARWLHRRIQQALRANQKQRPAEAGEAIEASLTQWNYHGAWNRVKAWYRQAGDRPSKLSRQDLCAVTTEFGNLYTQAAPPGHQSLCWLNRSPWMTSAQRRRRSRWWYGV